jgi:hypothetical protein
VDHPGGKKRDSATIWQNFEVWRKELMQKEESGDFRLEEQDTRDSEK